jgi:hypothetical protein
MMFWLFLIVVVICLTITVNRILDMAEKNGATSDGQNASVQSVPDWDATAKIPGGPIVHPGDGPAGVHNPYRDGLN